ncbi:MAG: hypothetical protein ACLFUB_19045 [Cyclobacteriaceae bacterium]
MRNLEDFYVKNEAGQLKVFVRLKPIVFTENDFSYEGTEIFSQAGDWKVETHELSYLDILQMYEAGFHTIEREEYERAEALLKFNQEQPLED